MFLIRFYRIEIKSIQLNQKTNFLYKIQVKIIYDIMFLKFFENQLIDGHV